uniref:Uncharacterized protein n=1 Tax=Culex tarsalis TaxID=7177 RepID=A0A1Q3F0N1_CULTA
MNPALRGLLARAAVCEDMDVPCRALVPYVPRVSLLEDILAEAAPISEQLSSTESDSEEDGSSSDSDSDASTYPLGLLTQTSTLSWTAADLAALDEHISEYYTAHSDLDDEMDFLQHTDLRDAETRQDKQQEERCLAVVPYNPPVSLWQERKPEHEPKAVVFHASLVEALTNSGDSRGLKRKREKEPHPAVDSVVWKKPRTSKVYRAKRRPIAAAVVPIPTAIDLPGEDPEPVKVVTSNTTLSWGDEEVDFADWNISSGDIEEWERERQQALVQVKPVPSKVHQPRLVVIYGPIRSFWDPKLLSSPLLPLVNERKGQILKAQHNKLFRFAPYDKRDRKWRKVEKVVEQEVNSCRSLVIYTGSWWRQPEAELRYLLHPLLVGYLSFCRYVTQQSTMRQKVATGQGNRGTKRKVDWEEGGAASMKRPRAVNSAP